MELRSFSPVVYRLYDGTVVNPKQLRSMFMGKVPSPAQRKLLGIEKLYLKKAH